jgi:uncharacterized protein with NRDE domain
MSNEAAALATSNWQKVTSTLANLSSRLWAQPHFEKPDERQVDRLFDAWKDERPEVKRFVASQIARGFWI